MKRNITLDYLKLLLSFLVIFIHIDNETFQNSVYNHLLAEGISRIAVPCFFIINGYFFFENVQHKKALLAYLRKLLFLFVIWNLVYLPFWYESFLNDTLLYKLLLIFNGYFHLWYLAALILVSILVYFINKMNFNGKFILSCSILFFVSGFLLQKFENRIAINASLEFIKSDYISRNFLTIGFPFFYIGFYLKKYTLKIKLSYLLLILLGAFSLLILEFLNNEFQHFKTDFLFSTLLLSPAIFLFAIHDKMRFDEIKINQYLNFAKLSTNIYFVHVLVIFLFPETFILLVFAISFILSVLLIKIKDHFVKKSFFSNFIKLK